MSVISSASGGALLDEDIGSSVSKGAIRVNILLFFFVK